MEKILDARGYGCPTPVLITKEAITEDNVSLLKVIVDNQAACENVARYARSVGAEVTIETKAADEIVIAISLPDRQPDEPANTEPATTACAPTSQIIILIATDKLGQGSDELGNYLMLTYIRTLAEVVPRPTALIFMNGGVRLSVEGSEVIEELNLMANSGIEVLSCGTCLDHFGIKDKLAAGKISNMFEIATLLNSADRVVSI
jgi:selenium metabolism protein YedF